MSPTIEVTTIAHDELGPSPLNPRKTFDPDGITELANSIAKDGQVYQNLIARETTDLKVGKGKTAKAVRYEIIAGERRWRAVREIMARDDWPEGQPFPMPVRVIEADDAKVVELATIENIQRKDLTAMEEARAFSDLRKFGKDTDDIADTMSMSRRHIQRRLALVDRLSKKCQTALEKGEINLVQARTLTMGTKQRQDAIIEDVKHAVLHNLHMADEDQIKHSLVGNLPKAKAAHFDLKLYDGDWVDDPDGDENERRFADRDKFETLQKAGLEALEAKLRKTWAWVEVVDGYASTWDYGKSKDKKKAGVIIEVRNLTQITVYDGLVAPEAAPKSIDDPKPQPVFTKKHLTYAGQHKTQALQTAVASDPRTAKIMTCLALMGGFHTVQFSCNHIHPDDRAVDANLMATAESIAGKLTDVSLEGYGRGVINIKTGYNSQTDLSGVHAYDGLKALSDTDLDRLFAALVAAQVGAFAGGEPTLGDNPLAVHLAKDLNVDMSERWDIDDDYLAYCKKPALLEILNANGEWEDGGAAASKKTAKALREMVTTETSGATHILPREMQFGSATDLEKAKPIVTKGKAASATTKKAA